MAAVTLTKRNDGVEGSNRHLSGYLALTTDGDYLVTGYTNVYSVQLTPYGKTNLSSSIGVLCSGGGTVSFMVPLAQTVYCDVMCD